MSNPSALDFILTGEAARLLDVSVDTIRIWERLGRLPAVRVGRGLLRLFDRRDVERLARERQARHLAEAAAERERK